MRNNHIILVGLGLFVTGLPAYSVDRPASQQVQSPVCSPVNLKELPAGSNTVAAADDKTRPMTSATKRKYKLLLGIQPGTVGPALKAQLGLDGFAGIIVEDVVPGSPAGKAGIQRYDVITKVGDKPISDPKNITEALGEANPGDKVSVELVRACQNHTVELVLDQTLSANDNKAGNAALSPRKHIDKAIGAGRLAMPMDMYPEDDINELYQMMSQLMEQGNAMSDPAATRLRIQKMREFAARQAQAGAAMQQAMRTAGVTFGESSFVLRNNQGSVEFKSEKGKGTYLTVKDASGKVEFEGPYTTDEDKAKVPEHIRQRLQGICVHMQGRS